MSKTSINIQPIKGGSEEHNRRLKHLDYVRQDLSPKNESWVSDTISNRLDYIKENTKSKTGRAMQKKATPIREGVVVIQKETQLQDLKNFAEKCEKEFGIQAFQIYTHKDEGHYIDEKKKDWKANLHAHIVFDWTNHSTGKSIKINRLDMARMQTLLAETLGMDRGVSSDKVHIEALQFKNEAEIKRLEELLIEKKENVRLTEKELKNAKLKANTSKALSRAVGKFYDLLGATKGEKKIIELEKQKDNLLTKSQKDKQNIQDLTSTVKALNQKLVESEEKKTTLEVKYKDLNKNFVNVVNIAERMCRGVYADISKLTKLNILDPKLLNGTDTEKIFYNGQNFVLMDQEKAKQEQTKTRNQGRRL